MRIPFFSKPYRWSIVFSLILIGASTFVLLDTFVIPKSITIVQEVPTEAKGSTPETSSEPVITDNSYMDDNIKLTIDTYRKYDSTIYAIDIQITDPSYLKTALAHNKFGRNIKAVTSEIATDHKAILAINGDFYGFRGEGYVLRNGVAYRDVPRDIGYDEALVINNEGDMSIIHESRVSLDSLGQDIAQVLTFGPGLVQDGKLIVDATDEVAPAMGSNPRTAIGQIDKLHYVIIVSDGRTAQNAGLSLVDLAQEFLDRGCVTAYNLDGGGSATLYFNGRVINQPTDGKYFGEREVSDIVYFGY